MAGTMRATSTSDPVRRIRNRPTAQAAGTAMTTLSTVETTPTTSEFTREPTSAPSARTLRKLSRVGPNTRLTEGSVTCTFVLNAAAIIHTTGSAITAHT